MLNLVLALEWLSKRRWRNGRLGILKRFCPKGRVGSNPTRRIASERLQVRSPEEIERVKELSARHNKCEIARLTGVPRSTISGWLNGRAP